MYYCQALVPESDAIPKIQIQVTWADINMEWVIGHQ